MNIIKPAKFTNVIAAVAFDRLIRVVCTRMDYLSGPAGRFIKSN